MLTAEEFEVLLPLAVAWAAEQERLILGSGVGGNWYSAPQFDLVARISHKRNPGQKAKPPLMQGEEEKERPSR